MALKKYERKGSESALNLVLFAMAILMFVGFFASIFSSEEEYAWEDYSTVEESTAYIPIGDSVSPDTLIIHTRYWKNYWNHGFEGEIKILQSEVLAARKHRNEMTNTMHNEGEWGALYKTIVNFEGSNLEYVYAMLDTIRTKLTLSRIDFAEVLVCFVQDIPYSYILEDNECEERYLENENFRRKLDNGTTCHDGIRYGVNTPAEFMGTLYGDCDTRTVFLFKLMSKFGYDVAILGSVFYRHSILGINMPGAGDYIRFRGKKYYVWETTNPGWMRGEIPPSNSTLSYWGVNLASQMN